ncbi:hypothetical protein [Flavobacterium sp.]|jgi:hypothetical protein|uniref:hypothetical protein n=1 Tax=Flavobacterium sp. TaxID=239 RepID=UPI0037BFE8A3
MDTNDKPENASGTQDLASTTANIASSTPTNATPSTTPPAPSPKESSNETSLAKEFTNGVIKVISNPPASRDESFEDDVDRACR